MALLEQRLLDGLSNGAIYAIIALAIVLIFTSTGTLNLAQGAMGMFTTFIGWWLWDPSGHWGLPLAVAIAVAIIAGFALGALLEVTVLRPVENSPDHTPAIIVTLGILLILQSLAGYLFTTDTVQIGSPFPAGTWQWGELSVQKSDVGLIAVTALVGTALIFLFRGTRIGLAMRAAVDAPESSRLCGISRSNMLMLGWALAGTLGAIAGILIAPTTLVSPAMLDNPLFLGFAAAAIGGLSSPAGAVIGGVLLGLVETLTPAYVPGIDNQLATTAVFAVLIVVLLARPHGLLGDAKTERV